MTDQLIDPLDTVDPIDAVNSLNTANPVDSVNRSSSEKSPSGHPIVRTEEGVITEGSKVKWDRKSILWALPQPVLVLGSMLLAAAILVNEWGGEYYRVWTLVVAVSSTPLLLIAERFWAKKKSWLLKPDEMLEDVFWMASGGCFGYLSFLICIARQYLTASRLFVICLRCRSNFNPLQ